MLKPDYVKGISKNPKDKASQFLTPEFTLVNEDVKNWA